MSRRVRASLLGLSTGLRGMDMSQLRARARARLEVLRLGGQRCLTASAALSTRASARLSGLTAALIRTTRRLSPVPDFRHLLFWIAIAVIVPTLAWFTTAAYLAFDRYQTVREMDRTETLVEFALAGNRLIHELQTERSLSAARIAGSDGFFEARLEEARELTASQVGDFQQHREALPDSPVREQLGACLRDVRQMDENIQSLRLSVDTGRFTVGEGVDGYSYLIENISACLAVIEQASTESDLTRRLNDLRAFATYKDFADLERGYGTALLSIELPEPELQRRFQHYGDLQQPYVRRMLGEPSTELERALMLVHGNQAEDQLAVLRREMSGPGVFNEIRPVAEVWFALASDRIEHMHRAERFLMGTLSTAVHGIAEEARRDLNRVLLGFGLSALLLPVLSLGITTGVGRRIRVERQQSRHIRYLATRDPLTGLYNREHFETLVEEQIRQTAASSSGLLMLIINLHRFSDINHIWGEAVGNRVLRQVGRRLCKQAGKSVLVARTYGDEYALLWPGVHNRGQAEALVRSVMTVFESSFDIGDRHITIQAVAGAACYPEDGHHHDDLLVSAQLARNAAREEGAGAVEFFAPQMYERFEYETVLEEGLKQALERDQLSLVYQPRVQFSDERMVAVEALLRWHHPSLGPISPDRFIPMAEANGSILNIGRWVLREACERALAWERSGLGAFRVSVNLSAVQFHQSDLVADVREALENSGLPASRLELELTETAVMRDMDQSVSILQRLRALGVSLSIDDFGTGHSSLSYLQRFRVHQLKLDKSFVRGLPHDPDAVRITRPVIALSHSLDLEVVAEGVETREQADFLVQAGCAEGQGYYYSRPLSDRELRLYLLDQKDGRPMLAPAGD